MQIVFLSISYSENDHISFYEELLQQFVKDGHNVYVVCACEKRKGQDTYLSDEGNIDVLRVKTGNITGNVNIIEKGCSTFLIDKEFQKAIKKYFIDVKFDLILYPTPPITLVGTVSYLKKRCNAVAYLLLKDIFPQNAVDLGMLSKHGLKSTIYKMFRKKEKKLYMISDYIGCMSSANVKYIISHNPFILPDKIEVCPNCVEPLKSNVNNMELLKIRSKYNIPSNKVVFIYGGNLGRPQGIDFFLKCLEACKTMKDVFILIVGGGSEANRIKTYIKDKELNNSKIIDMLPKKEYEMLVNACDVGLVFLDYRFTIPNFPSRILAYMQASKPIIIASDPVTDLGDVIEDNGFGWKCLSNDTNAFVSCVKKALTSDLKKMGRNGRKFLENNYSVENGYRIIMAHFKND